MNALSPRRGRKVATTGHYVADLHIRDRTMLGSASFLAEGLDAAIAKGMAPPSRGRSKPKEADYRPR